MIELMEAHWIALAGLVLLGLLIAWWVWGRNARRPARRREPRDVLSEGAAPAERNTALIDAPPAAASVSAAPPIMAGMGEVIAAAAQRGAPPAVDGTPEEAPQEVPHGDEPPAIAPAAGEPDDLRRIKGVGPKLAARLTELGIIRYDQIAAWTAADIAEVDPLLGTFQGRIERDSWVEQCRYLAAGDTAGYEARFGKV